MPARLTLMRLRRRHGKRRSGRHDLDTIQMRKHPQKQRSMLPSQLVLQPQYISLHPSVHPQQAASAQLASLENEATVKWSVSAWACED